MAHTKNARVTVDYCPELNIYRLTCNGREKTATREQMGAGGEDWSRAADAARRGVRVEVTVSYPGRV